MSAKTKPTSSKKKQSVNASLIWFEIPADDLARARRFYKGLFGWKIQAFPAMKDYWHIDTAGEDASPDGGLLKRKGPEHRGITSYINVASADESAAKVQKLGGKICVEKTAVPQMGYFVVCSDTEGNTFALWERNENAE